MQGQGGEPSARFSNLAKNARLIARLAQDDKENARSLDSAQNASLGMTEEWMLRL
jgi:hypothetical protein